MLTKVVFSASIALLFFCWTWKSCYSNINSEKLWKIIFPFQWVSAGYNSNNNVNNTTRPLSSSHLSTGTSEFQQNGTLPHNIILWQQFLKHTIWAFLKIRHTKHHKARKCELENGVWERAQICLQTLVPLERCELITYCFFQPIFQTSSITICTYWVLTLAGQWTHGVQ